MVEKICFNCKTHNTINIDTYKRYWIACKECGCAKSEQKKRYSLSFLPREYLKREEDKDINSIYDYMVSPKNVEYSLSDFENYKVRFSEFVGPFLEGDSPRNILDISGGNGHFLSGFKGKKNNLLLTEFNEKAIEYAKKELGLQAVQFDLNGRSLTETLKDNHIDMKFDLIMLRACSMFIKDIDSVVADLHKNLTDTGIIIMSRNVQPTLGTLARTQFDEFSYFNLRQPEVMLKAFEKSNLKIKKKDGDQDVFDFYLNCYDLDLLGYAVASYYKFKAMLKLRKLHFAGKEKFSFRRRDRQMFYIVAQNA